MLTRTSVYLTYKCIIKLIMFFPLHFLHVFKHYSFLGSFRKSCLSKHMFLHVHYTASAVSSCHTRLCVHMPFSAGSQQK